MAQKDIGNKVPLHTLKKTEDVMKFYDDWGKENKYDKDMSDWNYTGPKETSEVFNKYAKDKEIKIGGNQSWLKKISELTRYVESFSIHLDIILPKEYICFQLILSFFKKFFKY